MLFDFLRAKERADGRLQRSDNALHGNDELMSEDELDALIAQAGESDD